MKRLGPPALCLLLALLPASTLAASLVATDAGHSILTSERFQIVSIGLDYEQMKRDITFEGTLPQEFRARRYDFFLGLDALPWLQIFGTAGASEGKAFENKSYGNERFAWSAGANVNWWHMDSAEDAPLWRIALRTTLEYSKCASEIEADNVSVRWTELFVAVPLNYELLFSSQSDWSEIKRLVFYAGPAYSDLSGTANAGDELDFDADQNWGLIGGSDVYLWENASVGFYGEYFNLLTVGGNIRVHF